MRIPGENLDAITDYAERKHTSTAEVTRILWGLAVRFDLLSIQHLLTRNSSRNTRLLQSNQTPQVTAELEAKYRTRLDYYGKKAEAEATAWQGARQQIHHTRVDAVGRILELNAEFRRKWGRRREGRESRLLWVCNFCPASGRADFSNEAQASAHAAEFHNADVTVCFTVGFTADPL